MRRYDGLITVALLRRVTTDWPVDSGIELEPIKQQLARAYARLSALPPGEDSTTVLEEIEQLERELLSRYTTYVTERDSTLPPPKKPG